jgi:uncharacterized protein YbjQ (UPF0145 family)
VTGRTHVSASDFAALGRAGFRPLGQVFGTSVYRIGWQRYPTLFGSRFGRTTPSLPTEDDFPAYARTDGAWAELDVLTEVYNDARRAALTQMRDQAREAGGSAVIGVRYRQTPAPTLRAHEFTAFGTAITSDRYELDETEALALTNLGGSDFLTLLSAGYWPVGLVGGTAVVYVLAGWTNQYARSLRSIWDPSRNIELSDYTNGLYEARELVMKRMRAEAREVGAAGVLNVALSWEHTEHEVDRYGKAVDLILTVHALGTGVVRTADVESPQLYYALSVQGGGAR